MILFIIWSTHLWAARAPTWFTKLAAQNLTRIEMYEAQDLADFMDRIEAEYKRHKMPLYCDPLERAEQTSTPLSEDTPLRHLAMPDKLRRHLTTKFNAQVVCDLTHEPSVHDFMIYNSPPALALPLRRLLTRIDRARSVCGSQLELFPKSVPLKNNPN